MRTKIAHQRKQKAAHTSDLQINYPNFGQQVGQKVACSRQQDHIHPIAMLDKAIG
ncbi:MAG: hypothetical protein ABL863_02085 [Nitrosomonas sp.]